MIGIIRSVYAALSTYSGCNDCGTFTVVLVPLDSLAYVPRYVCVYVCMCVLIVISHGRSTERTALVPLDSLAYVCVSKL